MRKLPLYLCTMVLALAAPMPAGWTNSTVLAAETYSPGDVTSLIELIDPAAPDEEDVKQAREAYDTLSMAQKMQVTGYDKLVAAENWIAAQGVILPVSENQIQLKKTAGEVSFQATDYLDRATILAVYAPSPESPQLSLVSPGSQMYDVSGTNATIENDSLEVAVSKKAEYVQIDIVKLSAGTWTLKSSSDITFVIADYIGSKPVANDGEETEPPAQSQEKTNSSGSIVAMILGLAACVGVLMLPRFLKFDKKDKKKKEDVPEEPEELSEEEQKKLFAAEWAKLSKKQAEEEKKVEHDEAPAKEPEDKRLYETVRYDEDEDDGIEELTDEDFFGKKRF